MSSNKGQGLVAMDKQIDYDYKKDEKRRYFLIVIGMLCLAVIFLFDISMGQELMPLSMILQAIFQRDSLDMTTQVIINEIRLPRSCMAVLAGAALGFSGGIMQTILNNKLASPYTLGLSSAAGLGASVSIVTGLSSILNIGIYLVPFMSFVFTFLACILIFMFGRRFSSRPDTMVLGGIGLSFLFQALQALLQYSATPEQSQNIVFWLLGSLSRSDWTSVTITLCVLLAGIPVMISSAWEMTALKLGEDNAMSLGIDVKKLRYKSLLVVSVITGVAISFIGTIGFIGLVGPHMARLVVGEDQRYYLPASALFGAIVLSGASLISKIIIPGTVFPIGIITSLFGAPFFFAFIFSKKNSLEGGSND
ncbi:MAG: FecCD family ABC transporter permease [Oscillospiraceae bacterium]